MAFEVGPFPRAHGHEDVPASCQYWGYRPREARSCCPSASHGLGGEGGERAVTGGLGDRWGELRTPGNQEQKAFTRRKARAACLSPPQPSPRPAVGLRVSLGFPCTAQGPPLPGRHRCWHERGALVSAHTNGLKIWYKSAAHPPLRRLFI